MSAGQIAHFATQRVIRAAFFSVKSVIIGIGQLNVGRVPSVSSGRATCVVELHGGVMPHGIDVDGPLVAFCLVRVEFSGIFQPDFPRRVCLTAVVVNHLSESDVAPCEPIRVMETGNGPDFTSLVGVESPAKSGAGPALGSGLLMNHDGPTQNGLVTVQGKVGVVVNPLDFLLVFQQTVLAAQVTHFVLVIRASVRFGTPAGIQIVRIKMTPDGLPRAWELQLILDRNLQ